MYPAKADSNDEDYQLVKRRVHHAHIAKDVTQIFLTVYVQQKVQHPETAPSTASLRTSSRFVTGYATGNTDAMELAT